MCSCVFFMKPFFLPVDIYTWQCRPSPLTTTFIRRLLKTQPVRFSVSDPRLFGGVSVFSFFRFFRFFGFFFFSCLFYAAYHTCFVDTDPWGRFQLGI